MTNNTAIVMLTATILFAALLNHLISSSPLRKAADSCIDNGGAFEMNTITGQTHCNFGKTILDNLEITK